MIRLCDEQWERIRNHFREEHIPDGRPGRKPIPTRRVLEAVLWILNTGAQWHMLPQSYPNYKTVHRRFQAWCDSEVVRQVLTDVANELRDKGVLDEEESFIDATFAMAKGGGAEIGPTKRGKGMKIMAIVDSHGLPLSVSTHAANHHEVRLVQLCFDFYMIEAKPETLIGDRAYDSDPLDGDLRKDGIKMVAPHRSNRRTVLRRLDSMAAPHSCPLRVLSEELPWLRGTRLPRGSHDFDRYLAVYQPISLLRAAPTVATCGQASPGFRFSSLACAAVLGTGLCLL